MNYICKHCGHIFEDGEAKKYKETYNSCDDRGECFEVCPVCNGDFEKAEVCEICRGVFSKDNIFSGVCEDCINKYRKNFDMCYKIANYERKPIELNILLAEIFEPSDIEAILIKHIKSNKNNIDFSEFIDSDPHWFAEKLAQEVKKNENGKK